MRPAHHLLVQNRTYESQQSEAALIKQQKERKAAWEKCCCLRRTGVQFAKQASSSNEACVPWPDALIAEGECLHSKIDTAGILRSSSSRDEKLFKKTCRQRRVHSDTRSRSSRNNETFTSLLVSEARQHWVA